MALNTTLEAAAAEIPGLRLTSMVDIHSGMPLFSTGPTDPLDAAGADAFHSDLYRVVSHAMEAIGEGQQPESFVLRGKRSIFVSVPFPRLGYFWHVVTDAQVTIGFTQAIMRKYTAQVERELEELLG